MIKNAFDFLMSNIPLTLRESKAIRSFLRSVSVGLSHNKSKTDQYFAEQNYYIRITPQVYLLERLLNNKVHDVDEKIRIGDPVDVPGMYFSPAGDPNMCFFDNNEYFAYIDPFGMDTDFLVIVPVYYEDKEDAINTIRFFLNKYKLVSTNYKIISTNNKIIFE